MAYTFPNDSNVSLLSWGRKQAIAAGFRLVDVDYDGERFAFKWVVPFLEQPTEAEEYRLLANLFYSEFLVAPWVPGKLSRRVNHKTQLVIYELALTVSTEEA
jgi:hypothetical protein